MEDDYQEFQRRMFEELEFLEAPRAAESLESLLKEADMEGLPTAEVRKRARSAIEKYYRVVFKMSRKYPKRTLNMIMSELDDRRSCREMRQDAARAERILKYLRET
jgi:hypothetical protein